MAKSSDNAGPYYDSDLREMLKTFFVNYSYDDCIIKSAQYIIIVKSNHGIFFRTDPIPTPRLNGL